MRIKQPFKLLILDLFDIYNIILDLQDDKQQVGLSVFITAIFVTERCE